MPGGQCAGNEKSQNQQKMIQAHVEVVEVRMRCLLLMVLLYKTPWFPQERLEAPSIRHRSVRTPSTIDTAPFSVYAEKPTYFSMSNRCTTADWISLYLDPQQSHDLTCLSYFLVFPIANAKPMMTRIEVPCSKMSLTLTKHPEIG
jgi:hypothetical protein